MLLIGVGEVTWRIIPKCVTRVTKQDIIEARISLQMCTGLRSGAEAAVHAMYSIFDTNDTKAMLLIDASNAFNSLKWAAALHNPPVLCSVSQYSKRSQERCWLETKINNQSPTI